MSKGLHGVTSAHHYHATAHAKGHQDGFAACLKSVAANALEGEGALSNTPELLSHFVYVNINGICTNNH